MEKGKPWKGTSMAGYLKERDKNLEVFFPIQKTHSGIAVWRQQENLGISEKKVINSTIDAVRNPWCPLQQGHIHPHPGCHSSKTRRERI